MTDDAIDRDKRDIIAYLSAREAGDVAGMPLEELDRVAWSLIYGITGATLDTGEAARRANLTPDVARRLLRSFGFSGDSGWTERDVEMLGLLRDAAAVLGEETVTHLARVVGSSIARIAEAIADSTRVSFEIPLRTESGYLGYLEEFLVETLM